MNVDTNHLVSNDYNDFGGLMSGGLYQEVPSELTHAANVALAGNDSAYISKTSGGKLSKHMAKARKAKKKAAYNAKKRNR